MIISSLELYIEKLQENKGCPLLVTAARGSATRLASLYSALAPSSYATPSTAVALYASSYPETIANINYPFDVFNSNTGEYTVIGGRVNPTAAGLSFGAYIFIDRLSHQGGLNATSVSVQTTNLPTAALPRHTDGKNVILGVEIYTQIGTTTTTFTVNYTNELGVSGRTSDPVVIGGTGAREVGRFLIVSLQDNDKGVRSVQSLTFAGTTGTAGSIGIVLFKPLFIIPINNADGPHICDIISGNFIGETGELPRQTNLSILATGGSTSVQMSGFLNFAYAQLT